jgi:hypothetical protein
MIGEAHQDGSTITGFFYRFLEVDTSEPWFDIVKRKKADDEDVQQVNIPPQLKPNLVEIPYVFDLDKHCLYFVSHEAAADLSPQMVLKLLKKLTSIAKVKEKFGTVDLTVLTEHDKVAELLKWPVIRRLTIILERPNATEEEDDETVFDRLSRRRLKSETHVYQKEAGASTINIDDEMRAQAKSSIDHGVTEVAGKNIKGEPGKASSADYPLRMKAMYQPGVQSLRQALIAFVLGLTKRKG